MSDKILIERTVCVTDSRAVNVYHRLKSALGELVGTVEKHSAVTDGTTHPNASLKALLLEIFYIIRKQIELREIVIVKGEKNSVAICPFQQLKILLSSFGSDSVIHKRN
jgi:hypothetical protein